MCAVIRKVLYPCSMRSIARWTVSCAQITHRIGKTSAPAGTDAQIRISADYTVFDTADVEMKVLELFAGIGGYHIALKSLFPGVRLDVRPYDNNQTAVQTYELNLGKLASRSNIEHLRVSDVGGFDLWAMSPPCQPHTQTSMSLQKDAADERSTPFKHVCELLENVIDPPEHIICENVPGFIASHQFEQFRTALDLRNYDWQVFLVTPQQLQVPNRRPRVFVLASKQGPNWPSLAYPRLYKHLVTTTPRACAELGVEVLLHRGLAVPIPASGSDAHVQFQAPLLDKLFISHTTEPAGGLWESARSLKDVLGEGWRFVDHGGACTANQGTCDRCTAAVDVLPDVLDMQRALKVHRVLDIVTLDSKHTNCFTKGYRKNLFGAGSVFVSRSFASNFCKASHDGRLVISDAGKEDLLELYSTDLSPCEKVETHIRWFRACDLAKLHGYPDWFKFPDHLSERQRCALLGNGLSLDCVQGLLQHLLSTAQP